MREILIHCPVHGRDVRFAVTDAPVTDGQAPIADPDLICLDVGVHCPPGGCPVLHESTAAVDARLARSGLAPRAFRHVWTPCELCGRTTEQLLSAGGYVTCGECGATRDWQVPTA